jgi:sterol desaturase/sphingolipid hydroxylase (fatty acid hydroxylase superfamily)
MRRDPIGFSIKSPRIIWFGSRVAEHHVSFLTSGEGLRLSCFALVLALMALWEALAPRRRPVIAKSPRWFSNLALVGLNTLLVRIAMPLGAIGTALVAENRGWGILENLALPGWLTVVISVIALDLIIYLQHVLFHSVPILWRLHMVHHADLDMDVTTGVRFHTLEILLSLGIKMATVVLLGAPVLAVLLFEVLVNATSMFSHGNVRVPSNIERWLRLVVVTPDMHRVHHSTNATETNSNFGFNLPWWDYLCGTYRAQPAAGHEHMSIGLTQLQDERVEKLSWMLALPFLGEIGDYPINRRGDRLPISDRRATNDTSPVVPNHQLTH